MTVHSEASKKKRVTMSDKDVRATKLTEAGGPSQLPYRETSPMADHIPMDVSSRKPRGLKGKKMVFSPPIAANKVKPRRHFTREATKKHVLVKDDTTEPPSQKKENLSLVRNLWKLLTSLFLGMKETPPSRGSRGNSRK
jgi:hypothetical protein